MRGTPYFQVAASGREPTQPDERDGRRTQSRGQSTVFGGLGETALPAKGSGERERADRRTKGLRPLRQPEGRAA